MPTTMPWGESLAVRMEVGFLVRFFTIGSATQGIIGSSEYLIGGTLEGIDVSEYVQSISTSRGRPDQLQEFTAGTATITLWNGDRRFDPINESSPYWDPTEGRSGVVPRRKVTIECDGEPIFTGRITDVDVSYSPSRLSSSTENSTATITAADDFVLLASTYIETAIDPVEELSGARVSSILDLASVDFPATARDISAGVAPLGGGATFQIEAGTNALTYLQSVANAEDGYLFINRFGEIYFGNRILPSFSSVVADFADDGSALPYRSLDVIYGSELLYNRIVCSAIGGTDQVAEDLASQAEFGIVTLSNQGLLLKDDAASLALADVLLERYSVPQYRFDRLGAIYNGRSGAERLDMTQIEIGEQIQVLRSFRTGSPASVSKIYSIEGIQHSISPSSHEITFAMFPLPILYPLIIGDPIYGIIGTTNAIS